METKLNITDWARDAFKKGARDAGPEAAKFLGAALAARDPASVLIDVVLTVMKSEFHKLELARQREMGDWDNPSDAGKTEEAASASASARTGKAHPRRQRASRDTPRGNRAKTATPLQRRQLREYVWVASRNEKIRWADITVTDIDATIAHYKKSSAGIAKSIMTLNSARKLIIEAGVKRLGDVPALKAA